MQRFIEEIKDYRQDASPRAALRIFNILDSNKKEFLRKMDKDIFNMLLNSYDELANAHPSRYFSADYKDEFNRLYQSLSYQLDRII